MAKSLDGQVAIVSGGAGDIGRAIALELARRGAHVAIGDIRDVGEAQPIIRQVKALRRRCRYDRVDVSDADAVWAWVDEVGRDLGLATLIVPNAAVVSVKSFDELTPKGWREELAVNLDGAFYLAQAATQRLRAGGKSGRVVFVGSWAGHAPHVHIPAYCVSKAGLRMLCQCMAAHLAPHDICVNEVAPGYVDAGLSGRFFKVDPKSREASRRQVPNGRLITADEVARQVAYLCEPEAGHYVGATFVMDGGLSLYGAGGMKTDAATGGED